MPCFLGIDCGTSSIKVSILDGLTGRSVASAQSPADEMPVISLKPGWAEQDPALWWQHARAAIAMLPAGYRASVSAIGISYQMHGLVLFGGDLEPVRPAIIWSDSRAVTQGQNALEALGADYCYGRLLNAPGNFTASKMRWVLENEPDSLKIARWAMLPGDFVAAMLTGEAVTTASGLSEMILWDFNGEQLAEAVLTRLNIPAALIPPLKPTFGDQGLLSESVAESLGLKPGIPVSYRAGDQPNNAYSLNVLEPGEVAATGGTSGVLYGVSDSPQRARSDRVNTFLHVNHKPEAPRLGTLLCLNGCGSLNSWLRNAMFGRRVSYAEMDEEAAKAPMGSDGLRIYPFGNGAERILANREPGAKVEGLRFARHGLGHLCRAAQEGVAFALGYGMEGAISAQVIRAGNANLFLSPLFCQTISTLTGAAVEIFDTDGSLGAARGAAVGSGFYKSPASAFEELNALRRYEPAVSDRDALLNCFESWKAGLPA